MGNLLADPTRFNLTVSVKTQKLPPLRYLWDYMHHGMVTVKFVFLRVLRLKLWETTAD